MLWVGSEKIEIVCRIDSHLAVEVACVSSFEARGWFLAKNRQNRCEVCKVIVKSSVATMSVMGGSGDGQCLMKLQMLK